MTKTETIALHWIVNTMGYKAEDITYRSNVSPDFLLPDGWVLLRIDRHQLRVCCKFCTVLVRDVNRHAHLSHGQTKGQFGSSTARLIVTLIEALALVGCFRMFWLRLTPASTIRKIRIRFRTYC